MRRFLVFGGDFYYPRGGWTDLISQFDTMEEVREYLNVCRDDWYHVVDSTTGEKIMSGP